MKTSSRWVVLVLGTWPVGVLAQAPFMVLPESTANRLAGVAGTPTIDVINVQAAGPGVPLRNGWIVPGSERVQVQGKALSKGIDYNMDYESGVVYLLRPQKAGQTMVVNYLFEKGKAVDPNRQVGGIPAFQFDLLPNGLKMIGGFGMTERLQDGNVLTSSVYGLNNQFNFSGSSLSGLMLYGERIKQDNRSGFEFQNAPGATEEGHSQAVVQNFGSSLAGGKINLNYESVSKNFTAFGAVKQAGFDADRLRKERGLERMGFSADNIGVGGLKLGSSFKTIKDGEESIDWRTFTGAAGSFAFNWKTQRVDPNFSRFKDIAEGDREQLLKEAGLNRETNGFSYRSKLTNLSYNANQVEDLNGEGIYRRETAIDYAGKRLVTFGDQTVDRSFNRFGSLFEPERGQWGREAGMKRQWMALDTSVFGTALAGLKYNQTLFKNDIGEFASQDITFGGKGWSLENSSRNVDRGFANLGSLAEGEMDQHIRSIASMYQKDANLWRPDERRFFLQSAGIDRSVTRFGAQPYKDWNIGMERLTIGGDSDSAKIDTLTINGKKLALRYRRQDIGTQFAEISSLMEFERQRLGSVAGLERSDFGLNYQFGKASTFAFNQMSTNVGDAGAKRTSASFSDGRIDISVNTREVDPAFNQISTLVDPERDLLNSLRGFKERDVKGKWQIAPNVTLDVFRFDAENQSLDESRMLQNLALNWKPDKKTDFGYERSENHSQDPLRVLFAQATERMSLTRNLGKYGTLRFQRETNDFEGLNAHAPDSKREYFAYETRLNPTTSVKTEQTRTSFENGDKEDVSANTISTDLSKKAGVSVTDVRIDRNGSERDEKKRNYGFWLDFGNGLKVSYGYARAMNGDKGTMNSTLNISPAQLGLLNIGQGSYTENRWDDLRSQAFSNMQVSSSKPFSLGLFKDLRFNANSDTASDLTNFVRENRQVSFGGKVGGNTFGFDYRSQVAAGGFHGIDRAFSFATDPAARLKASVLYKARIVPTGDEVMIRNYAIGYQPSGRFKITNELLTNPEIPRGDVILGSLTDPWRVNRWKFDYQESRNTTVGATWEEKRHDLTKEISRVMGANLSLFNTTGSPLQLFWGIEQSDGALRRTANRYYMKFDQRPGPNQFMSFYVGNLSYDHNMPDGQKRSNWTIRMDYQLKF